MINLSFHWLTVVVKIRNVNNDLTLILQDAKDTEYPNFAHLKLDHKPDSWQLRNICVNVGDSWFLSPLLLFREMVIACEAALQVVKLS